MSRHALPALCGSASLARHAAAACRLLGSSHRSRPLQQTRSWGCCWRTSLVTSTPAAAAAAAAAGVLQRCRRRCAACAKRTPCSAGAVDAASHSICTSAGIARACITEYMGESEGVDVVVPIVAATGDRPTRPGRRRRRLAGQPRGDRVALVACTWPKGRAVPRLH